MTDLDRKSELILLTLDKNDRGLMDTGEIKEEIGVNQSQSVIYRMEEKLIERGLIEEIDDPEKSERLWKLTGEGKAVVEHFRSEIEPPRTLSESIEEVDKIDHRLSILESKVETDRLEVAEEVGQVRQDIDDLREDLVSQLRRETERIRNDVWNRERERLKAEIARDLDPWIEEGFDSLRGELLEEVEEEVGGCPESHRIDGLQKEWRDVDRRLEKVEGSSVDPEKLESIKEDVESVKETVADMGESVNSLASAVGHIRETVDALKSQISKIKEEIGMGLDDGDDSGGWLG